MKYKAIIEIPKGSDRRIHMKYDRSGFQDFGHIKEQIPVNNGVMPVAYGYLENTENKKEKDNIDVIVFSNKNFATGDKVEVIPFGLIKRSDEDHKVIACDDTLSFDDWSQVPIEDGGLILDYFGFKSPIESVEDKKIAEEYINKFLDLRFL